MSIPRRKHDPVAGVSPVPRRRHVRVLLAGLLAAALLVGLTTAFTPTRAAATPYPCDYQGREYRAQCANITAVSGGRPLQLLVKAAVDATPVSGTAYRNGDRVALVCWATSPIQEGVPGDSYWFKVYDVNDHRISGYVSDYHLTTGYSSDWLDRVEECSGNEPPTSTGEPYKCDRQGGEYRAQCADVTGVSNRSLLHLLERPRTGAGHVTAIAYNNGDELALGCWTRQPHSRVDGDEYWFKVFDPRDPGVEGYVNDYYLTTGRYEDWHSKVSRCKTIEPPPAQVSRSGDGRSPSEAKSYCPRFPGTNTPVTSALRLWTKTATISGEGEGSATNTGVEKIGTVQQCLETQPTGPNRGILYSRTHVQLDRNWDLSSRVLRIQTITSGGRLTRGLRGNLPRTGWLTTVYPPPQAGCQPRACQSETYFLTRARGGPVTGRTDFGTYRHGGADYAYASRPFRVPVCAGYYGMAAHLVGADPGGQNFEKPLEPLPDGGLAREEAGWVAAPDPPSGADGRKVTRNWIGAKKFDKTMMSGEARDRVGMRHAGARVEVPFTVRRAGSKPQTRWVDVLTADGTAIEIKVGRQSDGRKNIQELNNDAALLADPSSGVHAVEWYFYTSPITGKGGPTTKLRQRLEDKGIDVPDHKNLPNVGVLCK